MKRLLIATCLFTLSAGASLTVLAACGSYFQQYSDDTFSGGPCPNSFSKTAHWTLFFTDGHREDDVKVQENGKCTTTGSGDIGTYACYPGYYDPYFLSTTTGKWNQQTTDPFLVGPDSDGHWHCDYNTSPFKDHIFTYYCKAQCKGETDFTNYFTTGCISGFTSVGSACGRSDSF